jgi:hypothetical protein
MITENLEALLRKIAVCAKVNDEGGGNKAHQQVLAMFKEATSTPPNPVTSERPQDRVSSLESIAAIMGRNSNTDSPHPVAYLSTDPRKWDQCRIKPQDTFTVPVFTRATNT